MKQLIIFFLILIPVISFSQTGATDLFLVKTDSLNLPQLKQITPDSTKVLTVDANGGVGYIYNEGSTVAPDSTWKEATVIDTLYFKDTTSKIYKDVTSGELTFKDSVSGAQKLSELVGGGSSTFVGASVYNTSQIVAGTTETLVNFGGELFDTNLFHDNTTNNSRLTIPITGYYGISFLANIRINRSLSLMSIYVYKNGSIYVYYDLFQDESWNGSTYQQLVIPNLIVSASQNDYFEIYIKCGTSDAMYIQTGETVRAYFQIMKL